MQSSLHSVPRTRSAFRPPRALLTLSLGVAVATGLASAQSRPGPPAKPAPVTELAVYAAASLREALIELGRAYERDHPVKLVFNFGSSTDLARQIVAGNQADVFLSADEKELDRIAAEKLLDEGSRASFLGNQLVVVEAFDSKNPTATLFTKPFDPEQLARREVKLLALADPATVPAGRYAKAWLEKKDLWKRLEGRILPGMDVRATLASIESGAAQVGVVYRTDAAVSKRVRVVHAVPLEEGPRIVYGFAALAKRKHLAEARAWLSALRADEARKVFEGRGFVVLPPANGATKNDGESKPPPKKQPEGPPKSVSPAISSPRPRDCGAHRPRQVLGS